jgi:diadenosine tetraphosphate (Ap4A) HIT family hydrolase
MSPFIEQRVEAARKGTNPTVICRMPSGWAVCADYPFLPGYTILIADPIVAGLNSLGRAERVQYLYDMSVIGDALLEVTGAYRINYEILGNTDPALHTHILPRYLSEPEELRKGPAWFYDRQFRESIKFDYQRDKALMDRLAAAILSRLK